MTEQEKPRRGRRPKEQSVDELSVRDTIALKLYTEHSRSYRGDGKLLAEQCYYRADDFLKAREMAQAGKLDRRPIRSALQECFAPNLDKGVERGAKPQHPINIASQQYGSLKRVREIYEKLSSTAEDYVHHEMGWDGPTTRLAKDIFGGVIERQEQYEQEAAAN